MVLFKHFRFSPRRYAVCSIGPAELQPLCSEFLQRRFRSHSSLLRGLLYAAVRSSLQCINFFNACTSGARTLFIDLFSFRQRATAQVCCHSLHLVAVLRLCLRTSIASYCSLGISSVAALLLVLWRPTVFSVVATVYAVLRDLIFIYGILN